MKKEDVFEKECSQCKDFWFVKGGISCANTCDKMIGKLDWNMITEYLMSGEKDVESK